MKYIFEVEISTVKSTFLEIGDDFHWIGTSFNRHVGPVEDLGRVSDKALPTACKQAR